jgi:hypothetical protein
VGGLASSRTFEGQTVQKFVCRIENNTQSWVLYEDYDYQAFNDAEPTGKLNRYWSRSATDTLYYSAFNPTFVDDDGNIQQNKAKEVLKTYYSSNPQVGSSSHRHLAAETALSEPARGGRIREGLGRVHGQVRKRRMEKQLHAVGAG